MIKVIVAIVSGGVIVYYAGKYIFERITTLPIDSSESDITKKKSTIISNQDLESVFKLLKQIKIVKEKIK